MVDDFIESGNAALGESADVEPVIGLYLEEDEVAAVCFEGGLGVSIGALVKKYSLSVLSTDLGSDAVVTVN